MIDSTTLLDAIRTKIEQEINKAQEEHDENTAHGLCMASEIVRDIAKTNNVMLRFQSEYVDD